MYLAPHGVRINLAHVRSRIILLHVGNVQHPCVVAIMRNGKTRVLRHHVRVDCEDRFRIGLNPSYLKLD